jgi:Vacuolar protein sorting-associated protein 62
MRPLRFLALVIVTSCVPEAPDTEEAHQPISACAAWGRDDDGDAIDDGVEQCLLDRHAPVAYLPLSKDWTLPTNVDWYLARTRLRFHHNNCPDCPIIDRAISQDALGQQSHQGRGFLCRHTGPSYPSGSGARVPGESFFLEVLEEADHAGSSNPADWRVYGHVYRNVVGGFDAQYWFFYAYNDNFASFNHEGDWESVAVRLRPDGTTESVFYCQHGGCQRKDAREVTFHQATHPTVWVADGSHASYESEAACDATLIQEGGPDSCETNDGFRWFTWNDGRRGQQGLQGAGVLNVGEKGRPLNAQTFLHYNGHWGEIGVSDVTSGPVGPAYKDSWKLP